MWQKPISPNDPTVLSPRVTSLEANYSTASANQSAPLGPQLMDATGWTSTGWTGDYSTGFTNPVGNTQPLTRTMTTTSTKIYLVEFSVTSPSPAGSPNASTDFTVSIGNSVPFVTYKGGGNFNYSFGIRSVSDGNLVITPGSTFDGTITNISVKEITGVTAPTQLIKDSTGASSIEIRPTLASLKNTFIGLNAGKNHVNGDNNVGVGNNALAANTTGYWNTSVGSEALKENTVGSRCVAVGYLALNKNISGDRNVAVGTYTLAVNTTGHQNVAIGADSLMANAAGNDNVAIGGQGQLGLNTTGSNNIAIGTGSLAANISTNSNVAVGAFSLQKIVSHNNTGVGYDALLNATNGGNNTALGSNSGRSVTTGSGNTFIGYYAGYNASQKVDAVNSIAIGNGSYVTGSYSLNIGSSIYGDMQNSRYSLGNPLTDNNTSYAQWQVGSLTKPAAVDVRTSVTANAAEIGVYRWWNESNVDTGAGTRKFVAQIQALLATSNANVNGDSGADLLFFTKAQDGGTFSEKMRIKGNGRVGIGVSGASAYLHLPASSASAQTAPLKFSAGTVMTTPETGAFEFDGTNLYFTINGVRKTVQVA